MTVKLENSMTSESVGFDFGNKRITLDATNISLIFDNPPASGTSCTVSWIAIK